MTELKHTVYRPDELGTSLEANPMRRRLQAVWGSGFAAWPTDIDTRISAASDKWVAELAELDRYV